MICGGNSVVLPRTSRIRSWTTILSLIKKPDRAEQGTHSWQIDLEVLDQRGHGAVWGPATRTRAERPARSPASTSQSSRLSFGCTRDRLATGSVSIHTGRCPAGQVRHRAGAAPSNYPSRLPAGHHSSTAPTEFFFKALKQTTSWACPGGINPAADGGFRDTSEGG